MTDAEPDTRREGEPPTAVLLALYAVMFCILIAVLVVVGVYA